MNAKLNLGTRALLISPRVGDEFVVKMYIGIGTIVVIIILILISHLSLTDCFQGTWHYSLPDTLNLTQVRRD